MPEAPPPDSDATAQPAADGATSRYADPPGGADQAAPVAAGGPGGRSRVQRVGRAVVAVFALLVLVGSSAGWAVSQRLDSEIKRVAITDPDASSGDPADQQPAVTAAGMGSINILLVGSDNRDGLSNAEATRLHVGVDDYGEHTDTIMLIHIGKDAGHVTVVGFPRDSLVDIPQCRDTKGNRTAPVRTRINVAFSIGGPNCIVKTVAKATGVHIDHYVEVNFQGFLDMVDAVNGVEVCLTKPLQDKDSGLNLKAGKQTISGIQALAYVRARHIYATSDFGRINAQQRFITSMLQKATSGDMLRNPVALSSFIDAALRSLTVDDGLGRDQLVDLAGRLSTIDMKKVDFTTVAVDTASYVYNGQTSLILWNKARSQALFDAIRNDTALVNTDPSAPTQVAVDPATIAVQVFNGTTDPAVGPAVQSDFKAAGFASAGTVKTAKNTDQTVSTIRYDPAYSQSLKTVQAALPDAALQPVTGLGKTFQVIVGSAYTNLSPIQFKAAAPTGISNPAVTTAADSVCA
ncbi:MAG: hypothetical protein EPO13_11835 [Actinomycetota bacterium]|nr:MAG: hypothetical protein EPO13_11835 [Actinomycetota bacterium]